jgi:hypothetical protein
MEIKFDALRSAVVSVKAETENYVFEANASISNSTVNNISEGFIKDTTGVQLANFNTYSVGQLSVNFNSGDADTYCEVTKAINEFVEAVRNSGSSLKMSLD